MVPSFPGQSDAPPRLGLSLVLDLMIEANCFQTVAASWQGVSELTDCYEVVV